MFFSVLFFNFRYSVWKNKSIKSSLILALIEMHTDRLRQLLQKLAVSKLFEKHQWRISFPGKVAQQTDTSKRYYQ